MKPSVSGVLRRSFDMAITRSGAVLMAILFLISLVFTSIPATLLDPTGVPDAFIMGLLSLVGSVLYLLVVAVAIRTFLHGETRFIPEDAFTGRIGRVMANMVIGQLVAVAVIGFGFILIVPGTYLLVSLMFWYVYVADEHTDFIEAYRRSWRLTYGYRWQLLLLLVSLFLVAAVLQAVAAIIGVLTEGILLDTVLSGMVAAFITVWWVAMTTDVYTRLQR